MEQFADCSTIGPTGDNAGPAPAPTDEAVSRSSIQMESFVEQMEAITGLRARGDDASMRYCTLPRDMRRDSPRDRPHSSRAQRNGSPPNNLHDLFAGSEVIDGPCANCPFDLTGGPYVVKPVNHGGESQRALCANLSEIDANGAPDIMMRSLATIAATMAAARINLAVEEAARGFEADRSALRQTIAADLHDTVAQSLCLLSLKLDELHETLDEEQNRQSLTIVHETKDIVETVYADVRRVLQDLFQNRSASSRLDVEIEALTTRFSDVIGRPITSTLDNLDGVVFDAVTHTHILHILHEVFSNIHHHAKAHNIRLSGIRHADMVELIVEDDGVGFDAARVDWSRHFGLTIMRTRAERCGGTVHIHSQPEEGAKVVARFPYVGHDQR